MLDIYKKKEWDPTDPNSEPPEPDWGSDEGWDKEPAREQGDGDQDYDW